MFYHHANIINYQSSFTSHFRIEKQLPIYKFTLDIFIPTYISKKASEFEGTDLQKVEKKYKIFLSLQQQNYAFI